MKRLIAIILVCVLLGGCSAEARKTVYHMNTVIPAYKPVFLY